MTKCATVTCLEPAEYRVSWPGQPSSMCRLCMQRALGVAVVMGFEVPVMLLEEFYRVTQETAQVLDAATRLGAGRKP